MFTNLSWKFRHFILPVMSSHSSHITVKAIYPFKGTNNDELVFKKGDIITVTQKEEEGWSEGTLNGKTGWFPSNYVKEIKSDVSHNSNSIASCESSTQAKEYRNQVLKDMIESETVHVRELENFFTTFIQPLKKSSLLGEYEYQQMIGNFEQVLMIQTQLLHKLEESLGFIGKDQRVGGMFMQMAPNFKDIHLTYCANHPKAVIILEKHKDELCKFMEEQGLPSPGLIVLTSALSKPFKRLEKYQALLQELERHTEEGHVDRGDCQRAVVVYKDISVAASEKRRQKEMELEVLIPGRIRNWEGEDICTLGDIIHMSQVSLLIAEPRDSTLSSGPKEKKDRYFVLFPQTLLMLSVSHRISTFIYEGKLPLSGITITKLESDEYKHAFSITGNMIDRIVVCCHCRDERDAWMDLLNDQICINQMTGSSSAINPAQNMMQNNFRNTMQDQLLLRNHAGTNSLSIARNSMQNQAVNPRSAQNISVESSVHPDVKSPIANPSVPPHRSPTPPPISLSLENALTKLSNTNSQQRRQSPISSRQNRLWTMSCLRPSPPLRPCITLAGSNDVKKGTIKKKVEERSYEGDMKILQVIEAYCTSAKTRNTVNSTEIRQLRERHSSFDDDDMQHDENKPSDHYPALTYSSSSHGGGCFARMSPSTHRRGREDDNRRSKRKPDCCGGKKPSGHSVCPKRSSKRFEN